MSSEPEALIEPSVDEQLAGALEGDDARAEPASEYFELYRLAVEMADRVSARRGVANSFFLTLNTALMALLGSRDVQWYAPAAGAITCLAWWVLLRSYRDLNRAKFEVILAMEARLPVRVFGDEWVSLKRRSATVTARAKVLRGWFARYRELGSVERAIPGIFGLIYLAAIIGHLVR